MLSVGADRNTHRVPYGKVNDWSGIDHNLLTFWQKLAAGTNGVVTPANVADAAALGGELVVAQKQIFGAALREFAATGEVTGMRAVFRDAVGRRYAEYYQAVEGDTDKASQETFLNGTKIDMIGTGVSAGLSVIDPLDGPLATATGTRSRLGEKVDAGHDALALTAKLYARLATGELRPWEVEMLLGVLAGYISARETERKAFIKKQRMFACFGRINQSPIFVSAPVE